MMLMLPAEALLVEVMWLLVDGLVGLQVRLLNEVCCNMLADWTATGSTNTFIISEVAGVAG